jgi:hypothetical protein
VNPNSPSPPDKPRGLLSLLDPDWAHLIPEEEKFSRKVMEAHEEGRLVIPDEGRLQ